MICPQQALFSMVKSESIPSKIRKKIRVSTRTTIIHYHFGSPNQGSQRRKKNKKKQNGIQIGKEVKYLVFADDLILYIENPKDATRKLLKFINEFSKVTGYKINTQKSLAFLHTIN